MPRNLLPIPTQVLPAGSTPGPGAHRGLAPRHRVRRGQGTSARVVFGASRWRGWRPCPRPPASAALPPCCHSNALRPPLQHPAARGWDREPGAHHSPLPLPTPPLGSRKTSPAVPTHLPHHGIGSPTPVSAFLPGRRGGCPHRSQCCPMPTQRPEMGGFSTWRGPQAMEVTNCWEKNPVWGHRCTRVVQRGSITSSNTPAPHFWANIQTRVVF